MSYYNDRIELGIAGIFIVIILVLILSIPSCAANAAVGGIIVDKYRSICGAPTLVVEHDGSYITLGITEEDYFEYDIGEIYAQE